MQFALKVFTIGIFLGITACGESTNTTATNKDATISKLDKAIVEDPKNIDLYYQRALAFHTLKQDSLAVKDLDACIKLDSTNSRYYSAAGDILFEAKNISASTKYIEKALALNPKDGRARLKLAKLFLFIKEYPKAFENINTVLRTDVYNYEAYFLKGMLYKDMKDTNKSIGSFQTAAQIKENDPEALLQLAMLHHTIDEKKAALYYENAFLQDTNNLEPLNGLANMYMEHNKVKEAKSTWQKCIRFNSGYVKAYYNIGCVLMDEDSMQKAQRHFDIAIKNDPGYAEAYLNRGLCKETLNDKQGAIEDFKVCLRLNPDMDLAQQALKRVQ
jgi:tetratricopeptide (TPR) repeat protein